MTQKKECATLVELILAIVLLGVIILGVAAFDAASNNLFTISKRKTQVINELTLILDYIGKDVGQAIGSNDNPGIFITGNPWGITCTPINCYLSIRNESGGSYVWRCYGYNGDSGELIFSEEPDLGASVPPSPLPQSEVLSKKLVTCDISLNEVNGITINAIELRYDSSKAQDVNNPAIRMETIKFFSVSHSTN